MVQKTGVAETHPVVVGSSHGRQKMHKGLNFQSHIDEMFFLEKQKILEGVQKYGTLEVT